MIDPTGPRLALPMAGEKAAPLMAMADGTVMSRWRRRGSPAQYSVAVR
jgi:hypothetical protein